MNTQRFSLLIIAPLLASSDVVEVPNADVGSPHPVDLNLSRKECHLCNTKKQWGLWWISNLFKKKYQICRVWYYLTFWWGTYSTCMYFFRNVDHASDLFHLLPFLLVKCQPTTNPREIDTHILSILSVSQCLVFRCMSMSFITPRSVHIWNVVKFTHFTLNPEIWNPSSALPPHGWIFKI